MGILGRVRSLLRRIRIGADPRRCASGTIVVLPRGAVTLRCGIAGLVEVVAGRAPAPPSASDAAEDVRAVSLAGLETVCRDGAPTDAGRSVYAGGDERLDRLTAWARGLQRPCAFADLVHDARRRDSAAALAAKLRGFADAEDVLLQARSGSLDEADVELFSARLLHVRDIAWHVEREALAAVPEVVDLCGDSNGGGDGDRAAPAKLLVELRRVNAVLRSIDRIEIRGRDSAGLLVQVAFEDRAAFDAFRRAARERDLEGDLARRATLPDLPAMAVTLSEDAADASANGAAQLVATFVYKVAAEVGRLGDNVAELRRQIRGDALLRAALSTPGATGVALGHTRWASSGVISVPNCHPIDNATLAPDDAQHGPGSSRGGRIFVVLNGDVDNHLELRRAYEETTGRRVSPRITTDTKVIALQIERHLVEGATVDEAFRLACSELHGSWAIGMVTDLAPGRLFLSLRGSGQSLYLGVTDDGFFASSEVYGLVEETARYVKLDGEKERVPGEPASRGELAIVSASGPTGVLGLARRGLDGADVYVSKNASSSDVSQRDVRVAEITTRDVDRADFEHFFRKEVTQAAASVRRTLWSRVTAGPGGRRRLRENVLAETVRRQFERGAIRSVFVVGQGTAAVAGVGIAGALRRVLGRAPMRVHGIPATELSGFHLVDDMTDTLVVAVTQSGSTADTNRAVDLARRRGALVVAIVNRRNSDITYRAEGVVYTSDGRDVEMSVASTKAFYAQIVAGTLLSLAIGRAMGLTSEAQIDRELAELCALPDLMQQVLAREDEIRRVAERFAPTREHWAVVASGPNYVAAVEARIKLSELCYKSIAVDTVENKKHIDLSSEPLILVLASGNPESVLNDVVKDVAIFKAHQAVPIVFAHEGEERFAPYAAAVVHLPKAPATSSVVLCALAGHLFGYHAARAIDENARFFSSLRATLVPALDDEDRRNALPHALAPFRREYYDRLQRNRFTSALHAVAAVRLAILFDLATGVSVSTPENRAMIGDGDGDVVAEFVNAATYAVDRCARPIDAIKHQAKIVTVGTSRPEEEFEGVVATELAQAGIRQEAFLPVDLLEIARIQPAVREVEGLTRYQVADLRGDGSPGPETTVKVVERRGVASLMRSRAESGAPLTGTKRQVVANRRLYLGVGRGDGRRIAILPMLGSDRHVIGLVLVHLRFVEHLPRDAKERVLGAKFDRVRDLVAEANRPFDPALLDQLTPEQVVIEDADDLAERLLRAPAA